MPSVPSVPTDHCSSTKIVLASSSSYRQSILKKLHIPFDCLSPNIDETQIKGESIKQQVTRLAVVKAQAVAHTFQNDDLSNQEHIIIGSDQLASLDGSALGKPGNFIQAQRQLRACSGKTVKFYTGLCLFNATTSQLQSLVDVFEVKFKSLTSKQINTYLHIEQPYDCAGSFKSEGLGIALFDSLHGRDPNSLIGLPLIGLIELFTKMNIDIFDLMRPN